MADYDKRSYPLPNDYATNTQTNKMRKWPQNGCAGLSLDNLFPKEKKRENGPTLSLTFSSLPIFDKFHTVRGVHQIQNR